MITKEEIKGEWYLPGYENSVSGVLTFDPLSGAMLEIFGTFDLRYRESAEIILGKTIKGWVTLLNSRYHSYGASNVTKLTVTKYEPSLIFLGHRFGKAEELEFTSVTFTAFNFLEWLNIDGNQIEQEGADRLLRYKRPSDISFVCYEGCTGRIEFRMDENYSNYGGFQVQFTQHCQVTFNYEQQRNYKAILEDIFIFVDFITLCRYEQSYPVEIVFFNHEISDEFSSNIFNKKIQQPIKCIYRNMNFRPEFERRFGHQHLMQYESIAHQFSEVINRWFIESKNIKPVIELLLRAFAKRNFFSTENFMDSARAIETYHRIKHSYEAFSKEDLKEIKQKIKELNLPATHQTLLEDKLSYAYEPTLHDRLNQMVNFYAFPYFDERETDKIRFIRNVKYSRNYYTHLDESGKKKALEGKELFNLTENINLILFAAIFKNLGIEEKAYDKQARLLVY